jgi:hypothetical protein
MRHIRHLPFRDPCGAYGVLWEGGPPAVAPKEEGFVRKRLMGLTGGAKQGYTNDNHLG